MKDEIIKEELKKFSNSIIPKEAVFFAESFSEELTGGMEISERAFREAAGFYAGFKAAERLAKIEVLEEMLSYMASFPIHEVMTQMLSVLKAG